MKVLETERLILRWFTLDDAEFIVELLNEPGWLKYIGDKGVRNADDARRYLQNGPMAMYERVGFGLYKVELKASGTPVGMCGLIKRDTLEDVDIGFSFLARHWGQGYAHEAAAATMELGRTTFGLKRIVGITSLDNHSSIKLLEKVGLKFENIIKMSDDDPGTKLFARNF